MPLSPAVPNESGRKALLYFVVVSLDAVDILAERFLKVLVVAPSAVFVCV